MSDRKRVFDNKNINKLENETIAFFKDNITRFGNLNNRSIPTSDSGKKNTPKTEEERLI